MSEELKKRIDTNKEMLLKNSAITFSIEGLDRDFKDILQKKIRHNHNTLIEISKIIHYIISGDQKNLKKNFLSEDEPIRFLLDQTIEEIKMTDITLNTAMKSLLMRKKELEEKRIKLRDLSMKEQIDDETI